MGGELRIGWRICSIYKYTALITIAVMFCPAAIGQLRYVGQDAGSGDVWTAKETLNDARTSDLHSPGLAGPVTMRQNVQPCGDFTGTETTRCPSDALFAIYVCCCPACEL